MQSLKPIATDVEGRRASFRQTQGSRRASFQPTRKSFRHSLYWSLHLDTFSENTLQALREIGAKDDVFGRVDEESHTFESADAGKSDSFTAGGQYRKQEEDQTKWDNDPENPMQWPDRKKWRVVCIASWLSFVTPLASSTITPALPDLARSLGVKYSGITVLAVSLYLLGFGVSGLLAAPLSEMYGRRPLYNLSNVFLAAFTVACGFAPNIGALLALRLLAGSLGTACLILGGATCADVFSPQQRAQGIAVWASGTLFGSCIGPAVGGAVVQAKDWRWIFYILSIFSGANLILCALFMPETAAVILRPRAQDRREEESATTKPDRPVKATLHGLARPLKLLIFSPVVLIMAISSAVCHGVMYLLFTSIPFTLQPRYHLSAQTTGLIYLAPGLGMILGAFVGGYLSGQTVQRAESRGEIYKPEKRLDPALTISGTLCMVAGLLLYGWCVHFHVHIASALVGLLLYGFGLVSTASYAQTYVVEGCLEYAASVGAAFTVLTAVLSGVLPITGIEIFSSSLGMNYGSVLLAGIVAIACSAFAVCRLKGEYLRNKFRVQL